MAVLLIFINFTKSFDSDCVNYMRYPSIRAMPLPPRPPSLLRRCDTLSRFFRFWDFDTRRGNASTIDVIWGGGSLSHPYVCRCDCFSLRHYSCDRDNHIYIQLSLSQLSDNLINCFGFSYNFIALNNASVYDKFVWQFFDSAIDRSLLKA